MNTYFRFGGQYYEISNGSCISVNVFKNTIRRLKVLPSIDAKDITVVDEEEFNRAKKIVELTINGANGKG